MVDENRESRDDRCRWTGAGDLACLEEPGLRLAGGVAVLDMPLDHPRRAERSAAWRTVPVASPPERIARLEAWSRAAGAGLPAAILALFKILTARFTGQDDILIATPRPGDSLLIRTDMSGDPTVRELVERVRRSELAALDDPAPPLSALADHGLATAQVVFGLGACNSMPASAQVDLELRLRRTADGVVGTLGYSPDLFKAATMIRLAQGWERLVEVAAGQPDLGIWELPVLGVEEAHQLAREWNDTGVELDASGAIHELFEEQAARTPHAPAIDCDSLRLTYERLNRRANQLARRLRRMGVGHGDLVGVCLTRTIDLVPTLLGVLKAGAAYVPLDPAYPPERVQLMLEDSRAAVLVTSARGRDGARTLCLEEDAEAITGEDGENLGRLAAGEDLAYLIYTSGSTGRPKGVAITHRSAVTFLRWCLATFSQEELKAVLASTSICFDLSIFEIFGPLACGGRVVLVENALALACVAPEAGVTLLNTVPSAAAELVRTGGIPASVRTVNLAGEPLPGWLSRQIYERTAVRNVFNLYGPSEDTTYSTWSRAPEGGAPPSIGRPLARTEAWVLDRRMRPVPLGVAGELYLGGDGLARGYFGRPDATAEKFVPDPFSGRSGARLYRTGDLVRYRTDGNLDFLGRADHQVKIRGFRIEPGEIQSVLETHPAVRQAVVMPHEDRSGDKRLVAYLVVEGEPAPSSAELRDHVGRRLPAYMVPSQFAILRELPLTPNGKLDRRALLALDLAVETADDPGFEPPAGALEELLAAVWAELLAVRRLGRRENLLALGAHSLLALRMVSQVREALGVQVPLRLFFEGPSVAELAAGIGALGTAAGAGLPPVVRAPRQGAVPASFGQRAMVLLDLVASGIAYNVPLHFRLSGPLDAAVLEHALRETVRRHEALRTAFPRVEGTDVVQEVVDLLPDLPVSDLRALPVEERRAEVERVKEEMAREPFDLTTGRLLAARLLRLAREEHELVLVVHHAAWDDWSFEVLVRELSVLYEAFLAERPSPLPELPVQYGDFALWQHALAGAPEMELQLAYWRGQLAGAPDILDLPTDRPRPAVFAGRGGSRFLTLPGEAVEPLRALAHRHDVSLFITLLAAFDLLLSRYTSQEDLLVGSPMAARGRPEIDGLIGLFLNALMLRADLSGAPSFEELVGRVRETTLKAMAHRELPFDRLVQELRPERSPNRHPLVQVLFVHNAAPAPVRLGSGLEIAGGEYANGTSKLDLTFICQERDGVLEARLEFDADLFDGDTAERMLGHWRNLLAAVAAEPGRPVTTLAMLGEEELRRLLVERNQTGLGFPRDSTVHERFAARAAAAPEAVALSFAGRSLTYGELDRCADALALQLQRLGVGLEVPVGICSERSPELVIGLLAILKAGGAYVPLDPAYPQERLALMLEEAGAPVVLAQRRWRDALPDTGARIVPLDGVAAEPAAGRPVRSGAGAENLAYIVFTSGSTGRPKGVCVTHRSVLRLAEGNGFADLGPDEVFLMLAPVAFDASTFELWGCLLHGARLAVFPPHTPSLEELGRFLQRQRVTTLWLTAGLFHQMVEHRLDDLRGVRQLLAGGDVLSVPHVQRVLEELPGCRLINGYGPTESTTFTCCHTLEREVSLAVSVPIGRPIAATRIYVVDRHGQPVPQGVAGELWIGGDGLARGYVRRPELTAERFIPDPFGSGGERLYRTGDLVSSLPGGELRFLGRIDQQVKIRGFRIEPAEIEATLVRHPQVRAAAVLAREDVPGRKALVAYVVPAGPPAPVAELAAFLRRELPDYMVPAAFVAMEELPLNANGKVDRRALPAPAAAGAADGDIAPPATPVEEMVAALWADVLGLEQVGRDQDFFTLGGHSLLATRLVSRVRRDFGIELPLAAIFQEPTVEALARCIEGELRGSGLPPAPPIVRRPRDGELPLSFAQQRLWFLDQLEPGSPTYNVPALFLLRGELDVPALARALSGVVRRHEILRSRFPRQEGRPVLRIDSAADLPLPVIDLRSAPQAASGLVGEEVRRPFDLAAGPLLRALLLRTGEREHTLVLSLHHIVSDGWSIGVLAREVAAVYEAGEEALSELPLQYADFAAWQHEWLRDEVLAAELDWWRRTLEGAPQVLDLPTDRPRPPVRRYRGASRDTELTPALTAALRAAGRASGSTLFMTLLAAFKALLHACTGAEDILVGSPIAGRNRIEVEGLIGLFVNTLVLRTRLAGDPAFSALLARVREATLGAYAHPDVPFERLVEELHPDRRLDHSPLFQVMFNLLNVPPMAAEVPGLTLEPVTPDSFAAKFDLTLVVEEMAGGLALGWEYDVDLFDAVTIDRLAGRFQTLLEAAAAGPERRLSELPLLTGAELAQLLGDWNDTALAVPQGAGVYDLFAACAARFPQAEAVVAGAGRLTYAGLSRRVDTLAAHLRARGVGPEVLVGLCLDRTPDLPAALLAVFKAGGAYLPLDPGLPRERLAYMIEDSGAPVLLTQRSFLARLPATGAAVLCLEELEEGVEAGAPAAGVSPESLAYAMYTSGSTGRPKGVQISQGALVNFLASMARRPGIAADDTVLALTPLSFDIAGLEIYLPLLHGARLLVAERDEATDGAALAALLEREGVSVMQATPATWRMLLDAGWSGRPGMRALCGGEALPRDLADALLGLTGELWNLYGPTETTIWSAVSEVRPGGGPVLLGRPIANTRIVVLDRLGRPAPAGVPGELCIGGDGVARGYLGRPALTAERFVPDPFAGAPGRRLYRTGDLARFRPDGTLEFLGRIDHQVKVRGFRIELEEIEAALSRHPAVAQAVVVDREERPGDRRLAACLVAVAEILPSTRELREHLGGQLPEYMVPSAFVWLEALPLTPNGKVDRRALAKAVPADEGERETAAPAGSVEDLLAGLWAAVLGVRRVGRRDDFFELGGHSLLATQMLARLRRTFGVDLPLRALFEAPTVADFAARIESGRWGKARGGPAIPAGERGGVAPLSFSQERLWFLDQLEPGGVAYNVPAAFRLRGPLAVPALAAALSEVARRHDVLRVRFALRGREPVQVVAPPADLPLPLADLRALPAAEREPEARRLLHREAWRPFELARGPLVRALLVRLGEEEWLLLAGFHHVVADGWSIGVLADELAALVPAIAAGAPPPLAEPVLQYTDFARWQRQWMQGKELAEQLGWWKSRLAGAPPVLELPTDRPRQARRSHGGVRPLRLEPELAGRLRALCRDEGVTAFMAVLAGFAALLQRYSRQDDVVVGFPIANRQQEETEGLLGYFANTLALRVVPPPHGTGRELLARVREESLEAHARQDLPFEKLVEELQPERSRTHTPLFQAMLVFQDPATLARDLGGVRLEPVELEVPSAKFDLTLYAADTASGLDLDLGYDADLFDAATIERMAGHLRRLLGALAADPGARLAALPVLTAAERHHLTWEHNDTAAAGEEACVHELFAAQARRTPDAPAVACEGEVLTYAQLDRRANRLAHALRARGVRGEVRVAVCVDRSPGMVIAMLGVMKAGGAYVPLDPAAPAERLLATVAGSGAAVALCEAALAGPLWEAGVPVLLLDDGEEPEAPEPAAGPGNLVYVIYTSGSTGGPKGVAVEHRQLAGYVRGVAARLDLPAGGSYATVSTIAADLGHTAIFPALLGGGCLHVIARERLADPEAMADYAARWPIDVMKIVPSHLEALLTGSRPAMVLPRSRLVLGGEAAPWKLVRRVGELAPGCRVYNHYGPTEATVGVLTFPASGAVEAWGAATVPLGRPLGNVRIHLLDAELQPVPLGVPGELCIGGSSLARGYLGRPERTAERFVPDPAGAPGDRLYRTGDLARRLPDGTVEFLGRVDDQVKIRGYRVEPGEVAAALLRHGEIREAFVGAVGEGTARSLAAWVVAEPGRQPGADELRSFLGRSLPAYMVPAAFVTLAALPLTANGKVDRRALPEPARQVGSREAPRTPVEETLAGVWREILGAENASIHDSFFDLGGHSLSATRLMSRVREAFRVELPLHSIFEAPTIAGLSLAVEAALAAPAAAPSPGIGRVARRTVRLKTRGA